VTTDLQVDVPHSILVLLIFLEIPPGVFQISFKSNGDKDYVGMKLF